MPADKDAGATTCRNSEPENTNRSVAFQDSRAGATSAVTTEHLRRLWMAGARDITVTYDADAVRHRTYLLHPRTDI